MNGATALVDGGAEARHSGQVLLEVPIGLAMGGIGLAFSAESVGRTLSALQGHPPAPDRNHAQAKLVPGLGLAFAALLVLALISDGVTQRLQKSVLRVPGLVGLVISMMSTLGPTSRAVAAHDREDGDRATTLFVDAAAPAGGNGTQRRPCSTITCAVGQLDAGPSGRANPSILVSPGIYDQETFPLVLSVPGTRLIALSGPHIQAGRLTGFDANVEIRTNETQTGDPAQSLLRRRQRE